jgi:hypothetical protein
VGKDLHETIALDSNETASFKNAGRMFYLSC